MLRRMLSTLGFSLLDLIIPPRCEVCHTLQEPVVCPACRAQFAPLVDPLCSRCGIPLDPLAHTDGLCVECRNDPPPFATARAAGIYQDRLRQAIHRFKYEMVPSLAIPLGDFLADGVSLPYPLDVLCPVPLHPARQRIRGFNQSLLLAERLGQRWHIPVQSDLLARTQNTPPQMRLPRDQRRRNIHGAFQASADLHGRVIGLIDDVYTTGATLRECSRVLTRAGAERICVLTVARAVFDL